MRVLAAATPGMETGVVANGRWPEAGVFWPIIVAAAALDFTLDDAALAELDRAFPPPPAGEPLGTL